MTVSHAYTSCTIYLLVNVRMRTRPGAPTFSWETQWKSKNLCTSSKDLILLIGFISFIESVYVFLIHMMLGVHYELKEQNSTGRNSTSFPLLLLHSPPPPQYWQKTLFTYSIWKLTWLFLWKYLFKNIYIIHCALTGLLSKSKNKGLSITD